MASCLGLYIDNNIIKYAKVSKEHEEIKVEAFGTKVYDDLDQTIKQIIEETFSYKTPISINLSEELYNYFNVFALLSKKDLPRAISTEFDSYCSDKNYNPNVFETRYAITPNIELKERLRVIHISENKVELNRKIQRFSPYRLQNILPVSMTIADLTKPEPRENIIIVNIEGDTTLTTILDQKVYDVKKLEIGSQEILDKINIKENSYLKAYEICKDTTIYTSEGKELTQEEAGYLEDIMPTLYDISGQIRKVINESIDKIEKIYITGTGALINNIDLYFEEYLEDVKCEILKPSFLKISPEINIKDYVEVNSAISLALSGLGEGISGINFKKDSVSEKFSDILKMEIGNSSQKKGKREKEGKRFSHGNLFTKDFNEPLDKVEKNLIRTAVGVIILFGVYSGFSTLLKNQIEDKTQETIKSIENTNNQIQLADIDQQKLLSLTNDYSNRIKKLQELNDKLAENNRIKKAVPNMLNKLMYIMPEGVQITSIQNTTDRHIEIQAQAEKYEQLGYLNANIQNEGMLTNVISTAGQKFNNLITIKIEGDLP